MSACLRRWGTPTQVRARVGWLSVRRDRAALGLLFVLPVVFFSIFAFIFGRVGGGGVGERELESRSLEWDRIVFADNFDLPHFV